MRILFVEDNDDVRTLICEFLVEEQFDVTGCASAEEAEQLFVDMSPAVLVSDVGLPGRSGIELARALLLKNPALWVIFFSGYPLGDSIESLGPQVRSLLKPCDMDALGGLLAEIRESP